MKSMTKKLLDARKLLWDNHPKLKSKAEATAIDMIDQFGSAMANDEPIDGAEAVDWICDSLRGLSRLHNVEPGETADSYRRYAKGD